MYTDIYSSAFYDYFFEVWLLIPTAVRLVTGTHAKDSNIKLELAKEVFSIVHNLFAAMDNSWSLKSHVQFPNIRNLKIARSGLKFIKKAYLVPQNSTALARNNILSAREKFLIVDILF